MSEFQLFKFSYTNYTGNILNNVFAVFFFYNKIFQRVY